MARLHHRRAGEGPSALFVHGFPLDHTMWASQLQGLAPAATCLAPDLVGFGGTPWDGRGDLSMERHADDLARFLDAERLDRVDLVGLSMGGYVALAFWERHAARVRSLALVDTRSGADDAGSKGRRDQAAARVRDQGRAAFAREMLPRLVAPGAPELVRGQIAAMIERTAVETIVAALAGMRDRADRSRLLETVTVPALVVCGELDALTPPEMSRRMADRLPRGELALVPGAGHMSPMESPETVNAILREFLLAVRQLGRSEC